MEMGIAAAIVKQLTRPDYVRSAMCGKLTC